MHGGFAPEETLSILEQASLLVFALLCALVWWWLRRSIERREESRRSKDLGGTLSSHRDQQPELQNPKVFALGGRPVRSSLQVRVPISGDSTEETSPPFRRSICSDRPKSSTPPSARPRNSAPELRRRSLITDTSEQPPSSFGPTRCSSDQEAAMKISRKPDPKGALEMLRGGATSHYSPRIASSYEIRRARSGE
ncbi:hypothetical protein T484DRAFT_1891863 [Baffinella frigidus]|nr:hypothetical protein T484DRAFT_1891863 [Cryptophyta sp. CCMP2293]